LSVRLKSIFGFLGAFGQDAPLSSPASFSAFYERTHLSLFRYLYGLTGGPQEDVEDLTAEAFTRAWRARRSFHGDEAATLGWLIKIARRLVIDESRRRKARPQIAGDIPEELPVSGPVPEEVALAGEAQQLLWSFMQGLPEGSREILVLRYLLDWRVNQIAACLEIPENSVSVTIHRVLQRIRRQWPAEEE
jgi:RNA polymerase sigma-70 factor (ECF subfamily)